MTRPLFVWCGLALAAGAAFGCSETRCSDDTVGVIGNEVLEWNPVHGASYYLLAVQVFPDDGTGIPVRTNCGLTNTTSFRVSGTDCYGGIVVCACVEDPEGGPDICGDWSTMEPVEFTPWACLRLISCTFSDDGDTRNDSCITCEEPCFAGAPRRMPLRPECP